MAIVLLLLPGCKGWSPVLEIEHLHNHYIEVKGGASVDVGNGVVVEGLVGSRIWVQDGGLNKGVKLAGAIGKVRVVWNR